MILGKDIEVYAKVYKQMDVHVHKQLGVEVNKQTLDSVTIHLTTSTRIQSRLIFGRLINQLYAIR